MSDVSLGSNMIRVPLREDLQVRQGDAQNDGTPTYVVYDTLQNRYYQIGWVEYEILKRWHYDDIQALLHEVQEVTRLAVSEERIQHCLDFLSVNQLLQKTASERIKPTNQWLTRHLFWKIPIVQPDSWLSRLHPWFNLFYSRQFFVGLFLLSLVNAYFIVSGWHAFNATLWHYYSWQGFAYFMLALVIGKVIHELGHAITAKRYGCHIHSMGIALLICWPVLYTDTSDAWRCTTRQQRLWINAAGMIAEMMMALIALNLWVWMPAGLLRDALFFMMTSMWLMTLLININPLIKFDGYYLLADALNKPNLQQQAYQTARAEFHRALFRGTRTYPGERFLTIYALASWLYRGMLLLAISYFLYHFFYKPVGVTLAALTIWQLIIKPIYNEVVALVNAFRQYQLTWLGRFVSVGLLACAVMTLIPWRSTVSVPAIIADAQEQLVYLPEAADITQVVVKEGSQVKQDQPLLTAKSVELAHQIALKQHDIQMLEGEMASSVHSRASKHHNVDYTHLAQLEQELMQLQQRQQTLQIRAPIAGRVNSLNEAITAGASIAKNAFIAEIIAAEHVTLAAYIAPSLRERIDPTRIAYFYSQSGIISHLPIKRYCIGNIPSDQLDFTELAANTGGELVAENQQLLHQYYRLDAQLDPEVKVNHRARGHLLLQTRAESLLQKLMHTLALV